MVQRDIGCEACGAVLPLEVSSIKLDKPNVWYPGKPCPMCGSEKFYPIIAITETDRRPERPESLKRRILLNPWTGVVALIVTAAVVLGIIFLPRHKRGSAERVLFFCESCGDVFDAKKSATQPVKCPKCGQRAGYRAAACSRCSLVYSYNEPKCPHCGSTDRSMLSTLKQVEKAREAHKQYLKREREAENNE